MKDSSGVDREREEEDLRRTLRPFLAEDESLLWCGRPSRKARPKPGNLFRRIFGLFFFGFAVLWAVVASKAFPLMALFAIPFMVVGLFVTFGEGISENELRRTTVYAVTNRRVLIVGTGKKTCVRECRYSSITSVQMDLHGDGTGTLRFLPGAYLDAAESMVATAFSGRPGTGLPSEVQTAFADIPDPQRVYDTVNVFLSK